MRDAFGAILQFLGFLLNGIYRVIPSYGVAIILLTVLVRLVLFPLAVKQIRSMTAMQRIQPKLKELQKKHKGDRPKLNEEMMKLYKEHNVNPLGGCFPMLLQLPVFIALYAVIRTGVPFDVTIASGHDFHLTALPVNKTTQCRVAPPADNPPVSQVQKTVTLVCHTGDKQETVSDVQIDKAVINTGSDINKKFDGLPGYATICAIPSNATKTDTATKDVTVSALACKSPLGTGHLPKNGRLFTDLVHDKATFLGMHLACSPTQANTKKSIRLCTTAENAGGGFALVGYYLLVALMVVTTWYQQKQMLARQKGQQATAQQQQMQMMSKIMPLFMGFISLNFPAALSLYWVVGNLWMIGQQHFILKAQGGPDGGVAVESTSGGKPKPAAPNGKAGGRGNGKPVRPGQRPGNRPNKRKR